MQNDHVAFFGSVDFLNAKNAFQAENTFSAKSGGLFRGHDCIIVATFQDLGHQPRQHRQACHNSSNKTFPTQKFGFDACHIAQMFMLLK